MPWNWRCRTRRGGLGEVAGIPEVARVTEFRLPVELPEEQDPVTRPCVRSHVARRPAVVVAAAPRPADVVLRRELHCQQTEAHDHARQPDEHAPAGRVTEPPPDPVEPGPSQQGRPRLAVEDVTIDVQRAQEDRFDHQDRRRQHQQRRRHRGQRESPAPPPCRFGLRAARRRGTGQPSPRSGRRQQRDHGADGNEPGRYGLHAEIVLDQDPEIGQVRRADPAEGGVLLDADQDEGRDQRRSPARRPQPARNCLLPVPGQQQRDRVRRQHQQ